jgi:arabinogalactan oligomer/maltooligosaccharide transport system substrate-binding protein
MASARSPWPRQATRSLATGALVALLATGLPGCGLVDSRRHGGEPGEPRGVVVLAMGIPGDETIDSELTETLKERLTATVQGFRLIHPEARVELQLFPEERLLDELRLRTAAGTGPDLLLINNSTAAELHAAGLTRVVRVPEAFLRRLDPAEVRRAQIPSGEITSLPVLLLPQLACYDRRRLAQSPADLDGLIRLAKGGLRVGLPLDGFNLAWTFGSLGVAPTVEELFSGQPVTPPRHQALARWLDWLKRMDTLPEVTFQLSQSQLIHDLGQGRIDWTSCRSTNLVRLREDLGTNLGVAILPGGSGGPPSPLSRRRVLAFGRNSSPAQRQVAEAFARFVVTPLTQRNLVLNREEVLPVLDAQRLPVGRKGMLRLLVIAQAQMRAARGRGQGLLSLGDVNGQAMGLVVSRYLYGDLSTDAAVDGLVRAIQEHRSTP